MKKITIELEDNSLYDNVLTIVLTGGAGTGMICTTHGCYDLSKGTRFVLDEFAGLLMKLSTLCDRNSTRHTVSRRWLTMDNIKHLAADVNVNEIADHIRNGTLAQWVESWQMQMAFEIENSASELEKLRRENFGLKTTVTNLRAKVEKFYNQHY